MKTIIVFLFFSSFYCYSQKVQFGTTTKKNLYVIIIKDNQKKYSIKFYKNRKLNKDIKPKKDFSKFKIVNPKGYKFTHKIKHDTKEILLYFDNEFKIFKIDRNIDYQEDINFQTI